MLDDFTLYWLTNTAVSAARFYWESHINLYNAADVSIPAAVSVLLVKTINPRGVGRSAHIKNSFTTTGLTREGTTRPGNSPNFSHRRFARASDHCANSGATPAGRPFYDEG